MKYEYLFIDNDDTIMDFIASESDSIGKTLRHFGLEDSEDIRTTYSHINKSCWEAFEKGEIKRCEIKTLRFYRLMDYLKVTATPDFIKEFGAFYEDTLATSAIWIEGAVEFLKNARQYMKIYVLTNGSAVVQKSRFEIAGVDSLVDGIVISESVGSKKPEKAFFDEVIRISGCTDKSRAIMVGDSLSSDIAGGKACGIDTCLFDFRNKYSGRTMGADFVATDFDQLNKILFHVKQEGKNYA